MQAEHAKTNDISIPLVLVRKYPHLLDAPFKMWPGLNMFWPSYYRVSHIVTNHAVTYSAPVQRCATSDNVMNDIDISINFQVDDAVKFIYLLGFNELISQITEEAIRLVHSVRHDQVDDLREVFASGRKKDLNQKFIYLLGFNELISQITEEAIRLVHSVRHDQVDDLREEFASGRKKDLNQKLPEKLSGTLERTTAFKTKMEEQEKKQENDMRILVSEETQLLTAIQKEMIARSRTSSQSTSELTRRQKLRFDAEAKMEVLCIDQRSICDAKVLRARGQKDIAAAAASAMATKLRNDAITVKVENVKQLARIDAAVKAAEGLRAAADTEGKAASLLAAKRATKKNHVEVDLVRTTTIVLSGTSGQALVDRVCASDQDSPAY
ncbi:hypothetical protein SDRG_02466 [Saprolegnia diclina VS20]|uniref:Band 7 domain-containing protein n=1 Tax=Saprolegnia diclina (strain VS20) TaxID=1156394 RepID=T0S650_SAPDV|nr:hypothetical protein SDRG_02466 [Saprolegnia diclina VS20]EQC40578.1 hypothetical protein SDRG_02466 [Saprolegnia diclina VS20]|eukprot:XP_008606277.1 hypothetical protein SDRG_02466 [Saprolegnia diclina VS20]